jgi:hypothetical protein
MHAIRDRHKSLFPVGVIKVVGDFAAQVSCYTRFKPMTAAAGQNSVLTQCMLTLQHHEGDLMPCRIMLLVHGYPCCALSRRCAA